MMETEPCEILDWDTSFWGFRIARVRGDSLDAGQLKEIDTWCREAKVRCVYFLSRPDDPSTARLAERNDFHLVDIRLTFQQRIGVRVGAPSALRGYSSIVRLCRPEDIGILEAIARESHRDTRFYFDDSFPRDQCDAFYETWIRLSCQGYADSVLVAEADGEAVGYVSCHVERRGDSRVGRIGLVGIAPNARGQGLGQLLVSKALAWFSAQGVLVITVVTQGRNMTAQRLYERSGFLSQRLQLWYHKWYSSEVRVE